MSYSLILKSIASLGALLAPSFTLADGVPGYSHITGGICYPKGGAKGSLVFSLNGTTAAHVTYVEGPLNVFGHYEVSVPQGDATALRLTSFPNSLSETVRITLPPAIRNLIHLRTFVVSARFTDVDDDRTYPGYASDYLSDVEDRDFNCHLNFRPTDEAYGKIDGNVTRPSQREGLCKIETYQSRIEKWELGCSAVLISPGILLTAAHCHESFASSPVRRS